MTNDPNALDSQAQQKLQEAKQAQAQTAQLQQRAQAAQDPSNPDDPTRLERELLAETNHMHQAHKEAENLQRQAQETRKYLLAKAEQKESQANQALREAQELKRKAGGGGLF